MFSLLQPANFRQQNFIYIIAGVSLLVLCWLYIIYFSPIFFPIDDAYIVLHNAQVLHWGYDPNYLGTPALNGTTSIIHLALVALFLFWLSPPIALITVQWLGIITYIFGLLKLAFSFRASILQALLFLGAGSTIGYISYQLFNGLETGLALAIIVWTIVTAVGPTTSLKRISLPILCGTLPFLRPELIIFSALLLGYQIWSRWQESISFPIKFRALIFDILLALLSAAPWLIWYWHDTGTAFPQTMIAKYAFFAESNWPFTYKLNYSKAWLAGFILTIGYFSFWGMLAFLLTSTFGRLSLLFIVILLISYLVNFPSAFRDYINRYLYIILPFLIYGVISVIQHPNKTFRVIANLLLITMFCQSLWYFSERWDTYLELRQLREQQGTEIAQWCIQHLPANATILVNDAGYMAYATRFHLIDLVGLKTPGSVFYHSQYSVPSGGENRMQAIAEIIGHYRPEYLVTEDPYFANAKQLAKFGWHLQLLHRSINGYLVYSISSYMPNSQ